MNTILYAEDDPNDVALIQIALRARSDLRLQFVRDGAMAIDYLAGRGDFADRHRYPLPRLIFLDIKMPRVSGFDVLAWIKHHPSLRDIPVIMLSSSALPGDLEKAQELEASAYIIKACSFSQFRLDMSIAIDSFLAGVRTMRLSTQRFAESC